MRALSYSGYEKRREANNNNCQLTRERERERERESYNHKPVIFSAAVFHLRLEAHFFPSPFPIIRANETTFRYKQ